MEVNCHQGSSEPCPEENTKKRKKKRENFKSEVSDASIFPHKDYSTGCFSESNAIAFSPIPLNIGKEKTFTGVVHFLIVLWCFLPSIILLTFFQECNIMSKKLKYSRLSG